MKVWNWYQEEAEIRKNFSSPSSVGFTKPTINYKILADSQHYTKLSKPANIHHWGFPLPRAPYSESWLLQTWLIIWGLPAPVGIWAAPFQVKFTDIVHLVVSIMREGTFISFIARSMDKVPAIQKVWYVWLFQVLIQLRQHFENFSTWSPRYMSMNACF